MELLHLCVSAEDVSISISVSNCQIQENVVRRTHVRAYTHTHTHTWRRHRSQLLKRGGFLHRVRGASTGPGCDDSLSRTVSMTTDEEHYPGFLLRPFVGV